MENTSFRVKSVSFLLYWRLEHHYFPQSHIFLLAENKDLEDQSWTIWAVLRFLINWVSIIGIGATLFYLILNHYNEYYYVYSHSSKELPVYYIVSAFWEGQEGSFWLWAFWQSFLGALLIWKAKSWENGVMTVVAFSQVFLTSMLLGVEIFGRAHR